MFGWLLGSLRPGRVRDGQKTAPRTAPRRNQNGPGRPKDGPREAPRRTQAAQTRPKTAPGQATTTPGRPRTVPRRSQDRPRRPQDRPGLLQDGPRMSCVQLGISPKDIEKYPCEECGPRGHTKFNKNSTSTSNPKVPGRWCALTACPGTARLRRPYGRLTL